MATEDLNGTARYVGMGGAMDALGADISTIGTNPAGIGLFRSSSVSLSAGVVSQQNAKRFADGYKTNLSFDQIDPFLVQDYNGCMWEIHTYRFKFAEVLKSVFNGKADFYDNHISWGVVIPKGDFRSVRCVSAAR